MDYKIKDGQKSQIVMGQGEQRYESNFLQLERLGQGPMFEVFKVKNKIDQQIYAIKRFKIKLDGRQSTENKLLRVIREVRYFAQLSHTNIIRYFYSWVERLYQETESDQNLQESPLISPFQTKLGDLNTNFGFECSSNEIVSDIDLDDDAHKYIQQNSQMIAIFIQTEYCQESLEQYIQERDRLLKNDQISYKTIYQDALKISKGIVEGLGYLHNEFKLMHRNLKPDNIFINSPQDVKIGYLGLVKRIQSILKIEQWGYINQLEQELYMAPEQKRFEKSDHQVDIYSLGIIMLQLFYPCQKLSKLVEDCKNGQFPLNQEINLAIGQCLISDPIKRITLSELKNSLNGMQSRKQSEDCNIIGEQIVQFEDEEQEIRYLTKGQQYLYIYKSVNQGKAQVIYDLEQCSIVKQELIIEIRHQMLESIRLFFNNESQMKQVMEMLSI